MNPHGPRPSPLFQQCKINEAVLQLLHRLITTLPKVISNGISTCIHKREFCELCAQLLTFCSFPFFFLLGIIFECSVTLQKRVAIMKNYRNIPICIHSSFTNIFKKCSFVDLRVHLFRSNHPKESSALDSFKNKTICCGVIRL